MGRTCLGCRLGCCSPVGSAQHRPRREPRPAPGRSPPGCRPPRHAPQAGLRAHLAAKSYRTLTKKSGTAKAIPDFLAGAEGLEPSARGFGVDVGKRRWEQEKAGVIRFPPQVSEREVLVWCCGKNLPSSNSPLPNLPRLGIILQKNILERREETLCPWT